MSSLALGFSVLVINAGRRDLFFSATIGTSHYRSSSAVSNWAGAFPPPAKLLDEERDFRCELGDGTGAEPGNLRILLLRGHRFGDPRTARLVR